MSHARVREWEQKANVGPPSPMANRLDYDPADAKPEIWLGAGSDARIVFIRISVGGTPKKYPDREGCYVEGRADNDPSGAVIGIVFIIVSVTAKVPIVSMIGTSVINLFSDRRHLDDMHVNYGDRPRRGIASESRCEESDAYGTRNFRFECVEHVDILPRLYGKQHMPAGRTFERRLNCGCGSFGLPQNVTTLRMSHRRFRARQKITLRRHTA